jgi:phage baseplate assembly protein W
MIEKAISLPFSVDPYGKISSTTEQPKIWADRVRSVIGTSLRERVMRPDFGGKVAFKVFENQDVAESSVKTEITEMFGSQLPLLTLQEVQTSFDEYSGTINTTVIYKLPNDQITHTNIGVVYISGNTPPYEENL